MKKPSKAKAVKMWGIKTKRGRLRRRIYTLKSEALYYAGFYPERVVRVEIRELPRRRKKS